MAAKSLAVENEKRDARKFNQSRIDELLAFTRFRLNRDKTTECKLRVCGLRGRRRAFAAAPDSQGAPRAGTR